MTQEKFFELKRNLERMKKIRPGLSEEVKRLALMGDFSENAAYQIAKGRLRGLNQKMLETEDLIKRAVIIERSGIADKVGLGSIVTIETAGQEKKYQILGSTETDPARGIISRNSPIGSKLLGRKPGEEIKLLLGSKEVVYKIIKIE
jgi:transcription elongation factor GreA